MGTTARRADKPLMADEFLSTDPSEFGDAWRYELVSGHPVAMAPPTPEHGRILGNIVRRVQAALDAKGKNCSVDPDVGLKPTNAPGNKVRVPDASVWRGERRNIPVVLFEVMSTSNAGAQCEARRADLKSVEGVEEIVEIHQDGCAAHVLRRHELGWLSLEVIGSDKTLELRSLGIEIRLIDLYANVTLPSEEVAAHEG
jgi:Uma2 family endonuclease